MLVELGDYTSADTHPKYNWCHQINRVRVGGLSEFYISLPTLLFAAVIVDWVEAINPHY